MYINGINLHEKIYCFENDNELFPLDVFPRDFFSLENVLGRYMILYAGPPQGGGGLKDP